ncbi:MAG: hypothetical protein DCC71_20855 [Proteobacteria bacterium]|nr:MAG: hypothetical protein DCC71_20855 [Pseudomonadota bacterium]
MKPAASRFWRARGSRDLHEQQHMDWLDDFVGAAARPTALASAAVMTVLACLNPLLLPADVRIPIEISAASAALFNAGLFLRLQSREVPSGWGHATVAAIGGSLLAATATYLYHLPDPRQTTTLMLLIVAGGGILASRRWLAGYLAAALAVFAVGALQAPSDPEWVHFGFALTFAFVIAVLFHEVRLRTLLRLCASLKELEQELAERARSDAALRRSEARFRQIFENAPVMMHSLDREGRVLAVNDRWLEETGWSRDEVIGRSLTNVVTPEYAEVLVREGLPRLWRNGEVRDAEVRMVRRDGSVFDVRIDAALMEAADGQRVSLTVLRNVSASKRAREERERLRQQLFEARKLESLGLLAGGIAHDFNNLLAAILGNAHLALDTLPADHAERASIVEIRAAAERGGLLTRQLLSYAGRAPAERTPVDLSEQVREVSALVQRSLPAKVALRFDLADSLPAVEVDPGQLQQVIMNLLRNAGDALGAAGGEIAVRTSMARLEREELAGLVAGAGLEPGVYVRLDIADDGCGMDAETRERLFDPFFTSKESGHGLGMPVALGVVRAHGGGIAVESAPGAGTTFHVYLPASSRAAVARRDEEPAALHGSGRILLADDEPAVRRVARRILERFGYEVLECEDGAAALEAARETGVRFAAALLDLRMPGGGVETARALRALDPELPILLQSGFDADGALARIGLDGPIAFIAKPFAPHELGESLHELIARGGRKPAD